MGRWEGGEVGRWEGGKVGRWEGVHISDEPATETDLFFLMATLVLATRYVMDGDLETDLKLTSSSLTVCWASTTSLLPEWVPATEV